MNDGMSDESKKGAGGIAMKSISAAIIVLAGVAAYAAGATNPQHMTISDRQFLESLGGWLLFIGIIGWLFAICADPAIEWWKGRRPKS
jgi:hypothetical protein